VKDINANSVKEHLLEFRLFGFERFHAARDSRIVYASGGS
jgi:hypothetical protein